MDIRRLGLEVKKILKNVATYLQLNDILGVLEGSLTATEEQTEEINLLVSCVNFVSNLIATNYLKLYKTVKKFVSASYDISFENIDSEPILDIISVKDMYGDKIPFSITSSGVKTNYSGYVNITYSHFPAEVTEVDKILEFKTKLNERIFAYGVASEYLFIKGNIDDSSMWDTRFKRELLTLTRPGHAIKMPARKFV